jgi:hypothetical protein
VAAKRDVDDHKVFSKKLSGSQQTLGDRVIRIFQEFVNHYSVYAPGIPIETEMQVIGALAGFLSSLAPDLRVFMERQIAGAPQQSIDMLVENASERVVVELKRSLRSLDPGIHQVEYYMSAAKASEGILFIYPRKATDYQIDLHVLGDSTEHKLLYVLRPCTKDRLS